MSESVGIEETTTTMDTGNETTIDRPSGRRRSDRIVGGSRASEDVVELALAAAATEAPVVISGPEGSGKKHISRAIHTWSPRTDGPFVVVSCGTIEATDLKRELFGSVETAGAAESAEYGGALARAAGGTVLIDGADSAPPEVVSSLSRALAERRFQREGDGAAIPVRARVVVTSRQPLADQTLAGVEHHAITLLPLDDRREDVLPLAAHFLRLAADDESVTPVGFTSDARNALLAETWPGNVRELAERVRQSVKLAGSGAISAEALLLATDGDEIPSFKEAKRAFETRYVVGLLRRCGGNISRAARLAKKDRKDFYDVIRRTGVNPSDFR
ncbi:sigma 54-interacting transcriptional regulator [Myxococcota bacterium]|nr:sigma 54-interacting transcriptional regulator [Myxococcota bacterium]